MSETFKTGNSFAKEFEKVKNSTFTSMSRLSDIFKGTGAPNMAGQVNPSHMIIQSVYVLDQNVVHVREIMEHMVEVQHRQVNLLQEIRDLLKNGLGGDGDGLPFGAAWKRRAPPAGRKKPRTKRRWWQRAKKPLRTGPTGPRTGPRTSPTARPGTGTPSRVGSAISTAGKFAVRIGIRLIPVVGTAVVIYEIFSAFRKISEDSKFRGSPQKRFQLRRTMMLMEQAIKEYNEILASNPEHPALSDLKENITRYAERLTQLATELDAELAKNGLPPVYSKAIEGVSIPQSELIEQVNPQAVSDLDDGSSLSISASKRKKDQNEYDAVEIEFEAEKIEFKHDILHINTNMGASSGIVSSLGGDSEQTVNGKVEPEQTVTGNTADGHGVGSEANPVSPNESPTETTNTNPPQTPFDNHSVDRKDQEWWGSGGNSAPPSSTPTTTPSAAPQSTERNTGSMDGGVNQLQRQVAGTRKGDLSERLSRDLKYAASKAGDEKYKIEIDVTSGGQRMPGAPGKVGSNRHDSGGAADFNAFLVDRESGKRTVLDHRNPNHQKYLSTLTKEFARAHPRAGVGADYMTDPTKIHFGGPNLPGGAPVAYAGPDWFRRAHQEGVEQRRQDQKNKFDPVADFLKKKNEAVINHRPDDSERMAAYGRFLSGGQKPAPPPEPKPIPPVPAAPPSPAPAPGASTGGEAPPSPQAPPVSSPSHSSEVMGWFGEM